MTWHVFGGAVVCLVLGLVGLYEWEQSEYNTDQGPIDKSVWYGYDRVTITGLMFAVTFIPPGVALLYAAVSQLLHLALSNVASESRRTAAAAATTTPSPTTVSRGAQDDRVVAGEIIVVESQSSSAGPVYHAVIAYLCLASTLFIAGVAGGATWGRRLLSCGVIFCVGNQSTNVAAVSYKGEGFNGGMGCMVFFALCPMGVMMWWRGVRVWMAQRAELTAGPTADMGLDSPRSDRKPGMLRFQPPSRRRELLWVGGALLVVLFFALISFYLPADPRKFTPTAISAYAKLDIAFSARKHNSTHTAPELPRAFMKTSSWRLSDAVVLKLYPGNVLFFGYLALLIVTVWCVQQSVTSRHWMARRFACYPSWSLGEGLLAVSMTLMATLFLVHWIHDHNYKYAWSEGKEQSSYMYTSELYARGFGMVATMLLSFLMFPVSRHSTLHRMLGSSYETVLWMHRALGYAMLAATVLHIGFFLYAYYVSGQLWNNLNYIPVRCCSHLVRNDFVIPVVTWTTYVMLISMGIFALNYVRRRYYELFYYSHLISTWCMMPVLLWHVSAGWQYLLPGLTVWFVDFLVRLFQRAVLADVAYTQVISANIVEIGFAVRHERSRSVLKCARPGQFVFLSVAELSALQWHPFTLSSVADGGATRASAPYTVHIKSMGPGTWTQRLYDRIARGEPLTLAVEGPCGSPLDVTQYEEIYLVCGGIGVTPCASIFGSVLRWAREGAETGSGVVLPRRVKLIWACRSSKLVQAMAPALGLSEVLHAALCRALEARPSGSSTDGKNTTRAVAEGTTEDETGTIGQSASNSQASNSGAEAGHEREAPASHPHDTHDATTNTNNNDNNNNVTNNTWFIGEDPSRRSAVPDAAAPSAQCGINIGSTLFEVVVYMTRDDAFDHLCSFGNDMNHADGRAASPPYTAGTTLPVPLKVVRGRPDLHQEVVSAYRLGLGSDEVTVADPARTILFTCGPELLTTAAVGVGSELGIHVHQEESYL